MLCPDASEGSRTFVFDSILFFTGPPGVATIFGSVSVDCFGGDDEEDEDENILDMPPKRFDAILLVEAVVLSDEGEEGCGDIADEADAMGDAAVRRRVEAQSVSPPLAAERRLSPPLRSAIPWRFATELPPLS